MHHRQFTPVHNKTRTVRIVVFLIAIVFLCFIPAVRTTVTRGVSIVGVSIARSTNSALAWAASISVAFHSKYALEAENADLKNQIQELTARLSERNQLFAENADLKAVLGRSGVLKLTLASVIEKPPASLYDTLIIDGGTAAGFMIGQTVYANGETPIGTISQVLPYSATVTLYSTSGEKTDARLNPSNIDVTLVGEGGGDFVATVPHDVPIDASVVSVTKEINPHIIALYKKVTSDERDPFQTLLLVAPVNINQLSYVEVAQ